MAVRRIGLIGAECSGKSTLARGLATALPGVVVPEQLRAFVDEHGRPPRADEQAALLARQAHAEDAAATATSLPWVIGDPAPLMTAIYHLAYFDDASLLVQGVQQARHSALLLWCDIDMPWQADGLQRDGEPWRSRVHELIAGPVTDALDAAAVPVLKVSGPSEDRVRAVLAHLDAEAWQHEHSVRPT